MPQVKKITQKVFDTTPKTMKIRMDQTQHDMCAELNTDKFYKQIAVQK